MQSSTSSAIRRDRDFLVGAALGLLIWMLVFQLGLFLLVPPLREESAWTAWPFILIGAWLYHARHHRVLLGVTASLAIMWMLVCFTPLPRWLLQKTSLEQKPVAADAVVVLSSGMQPDGDWQDAGLARLLRGLELVRSGYAPVLIVTDVKDQPAQVKEAAQQLAANLRISLNMESVGPVLVTRDEAVLVEKLARQRGWRKILLVTPPSHSRRACLTFRKVGLEVVSVPAQETRYDFQQPLYTNERLNGFGAALRELVGLQIYRWRGWV